MNFNKYCEDEYIDHTVYSRLANLESNEERKNILLKLAAQEKEHLQFWSSLGGRYSNNFMTKVRINLIIFLRYLFGLTFAIKFMERNERRVISEYKKALEKLEGENRIKLERIIYDEVEHENYWISQIKERAVTYIGFIILGLADAIIEITGVHAGFLGVTASTIVAGIAGLVVGISASIAMASAAYLQAQQGSLGNPRLSAIYTGFSYIMTAVALATPYFLTHIMLLAFTLSLIVALALLAFFNFYSAVISDREFIRDYLFNAGLILLTAFVSFFFGTFLGEYFGITGIFH
jgi:VIT1/CCC1 family predicted Fe2+/Mn2+ transporter